MPPVRVPVLVLDPSLENVPSPRVHDEAPRDKGYAVEGLLQEVADVVWGDAKSVLRDIIFD